MHIVSVTFKAKIWYQPSQQGPIILLTPMRAPPLEEMTYKTSLRKMDQVYILYYDHKFRIFCYDSVKNGQQF